MIEFAKAPPTEPGPVEFAKADEKDTTNLAELLKEREAEAQVVAEREKLETEMSRCAHLARVYALTVLFPVAAMVVSQVTYDEANLTSRLFNWTAFGPGALLGIAFAYLSFGQLAERTRLKKRLAND